MRSCEWMHLPISSLWGHVAGMRCMQGGSLCSLNMGVLHARLVPEDGDGHGRITQYARHALDRFLARKRIALVAKARALLVAEAPDEATAVEGTPLPVNPDALAALRQRGQQQQQNGVRRWFALRRLPCSVLNVQRFQRLSKLPGNKLVEQAAS